MTDSDDELLKRLDDVSTDWDGTDIVDGAPTRVDVTAGEARQAAARIRELKAELKNAEDLLAVVKPSDIGLIIAGEAVILPVEPTEAILDAIEDCVLDDIRPQPRRGMPSDVAIIYRAMIRASQEN